MERPGQIFTGGELHPQVSFWKSQAPEIERFFNDSKVNKYFGFLKSGKIKTVSQRVCDKKKIELTKVSGVVDSNNRVTKK